MADEDFHALLRLEGTQATRLGSDIESRFWLSYRRMEAKDGSREWFIGPYLDPKMSALQGSLSQAAAAMFC